MEEAVEKAKRIVSFNPLRDGDFDDDWAEDSIDVARALLSSSERVKELEKMLAFYTSTPRS